MPAGERLLVIGRDVRAGCTGIGNDDGVSGKDRLQRSNHPLGPDRSLGALGKPAEFHVIEAPYGHDCFLLEEARQTPIIRRFLGSE